MSVTWGWCHRACAWGLGLVVVLTSACRLAESDPADDTLDPGVTAEEQASVDTAGLSAGAHQRLDAQAQAILRRIQSPWFAGTFDASTPSFAQNPKDEKSILVTYEGAHYDGKSRVAIFTFKESELAFVDALLLVSEVNDLLEPAEAFSFRLLQTGELEKAVVQESHYQYDSCEQCITNLSSVIKYVLERIEVLYTVKGSLSVCVPLVATNPQLWATTLSVMLAAGPLVATLVPLLTVAACVAVVQLATSQLSHVPVQGACQAFANLVCRKMTTYCHEETRARPDQVSCLGQTSGFSSVNDVTYYVPYLDFRRNASRLVQDQRFELHVFGRPRGSVRDERWNSLAMKRNRSLQATSGSAFGLGLQWQSEDQRIRVKKTPTEEDHVYVTHQPADGAEGTPVYDVPLSCL